MQALLAPEHMHAGFTCTGTHACRFYLHWNTCVQCQNFVQIFKYRSIANITNSLSADKE